MQKKPRISHNQVLGEGAHDDVPPGQLVLLGSAMSLLPVTASCR